MLDRGRQVCQEILRSAPSPTVANAPVARRSVAVQLSMLYSARIFLRRAGLVVEFRLESAPPNSGIFYAAYCCLLHDVSSFRGAPADFANRNCAPFGVLILSLEGARRGRSQRMRFRIVCAWAPRCIRGASKSQTCPWPTRDAATRYCEVSPPEPSGTRFNSNHAITCRSAAVA